MRRLPFSSSWIWLAVCLVIIGAITVLTQRPSSTPPPLTADSARPDGALALDLWLQRLGYSVTVGHDAPSPGSASTLMLLASGADIGSGDTGRILAWVRSGGRLVVAADGATGNTVLKALGVTPVLTTPSAVRITQPLLLSPPTAYVSATTDTVLQLPDTWAEAAAGDNGVALAERSMGRGVIWVLTATQMLDNADIALAGNRRVLLNLAGRPGSRVLLDEYQPPTAAAPVGDWIVDTAWGIVAMFLVALAVLFRWLGGWRLGPPVVPLADRYRSATEYVVSLAGLLQRARSRGDVLAVYQRSLGRLIRRRYGDLTGAPLSAEERQRLERLLAPRPSISESDLVTAASAIVQEEEVVQHGGI